MANTYKMETIRVGDDLWEVHYRLVNDSICPMIRIEADLLRKDKKWYQSKYTYCDYTYRNDADKANTAAKDLIDNYYDNQVEQKKIIEFFITNT